MEKTWKNTIVYFILRISGHEANSPWQVFALHGKWKTTGGLVEGKKILKWMLNN